MTPPEIYEKFKARFGDAVIELKADALNPWIKIAPQTVADAALFLRDDPSLAFASLMSLTGIDWPAKGVCEVVYHLSSMTHHHRIVIKTEVPRDTPRLPSVERVWPTANWHEREAYDLVGIIFEGHSDLRRILLPEDWEGHPLRKDYTIQESYHGVRVMNPEKQS